MTLRYHLILIVYRIVEREKRDRDRSLRDNSRRIRRERSDRDKYYSRRIERKKRDWGRSIRRRLNGNTAD